MLQLEITEILAFYDLPQLILAKDKNNIKYIGLLQFDESYLVVKIEEEQLKKFKDRKIDLLHLLLNQNTYFKAVIDFDNPNLLNANYFDANKIRSSMLPNSGFYI